MCHNKIMNCTMCMHAVDNKIELCPDGLLGKMCVSMALNMPKIVLDVKITHPRIQSVTYVDMAMYLATIVEWILCEDCRRIMSPIESSSEDDVALLFSDSKMNLVDHDELVRELGQEVEAA